jgi:hypothetical protein
MVYQACYWLAPEALNGFLLLSTSYTPACLFPALTTHVCALHLSLHFCRMESSIAGLEQAEAFQAVQPETVEAQAPPVPTTAPAPVTTASTELAAG